MEKNRVIFTVKGNLVNGDVTHVQRNLNHPNVINPRRMRQSVTVFGLCECVCVSVMSLHAAKGIYTTRWTYRLALRNNQKIFKIQISLKSFLSEVRMLVAHLWLNCWLLPSMR